MRRFRKWRDSERQGEDEAQVTFLGIISTNCERIMIESILLKSLHFSSLDIELTLSIRDAAGTTPRLAFVFFLLFLKLTLLLHFYYGLQLVFYTKIFMYDL